MADGESTDLVLTTPLAPEAVELLDAVSEGLQRAGKWPVFDFVERTLSRRGIDARAALGLLPRVYAPLGQGSYGLLWWDTPGSAVPPSAHVGLTVAGLHCRPATAQIAKAFVGVLKYLSDREISLKPDPTQVVEDSISGEEVEAELRRVLGAAQSPFGHIDLATDLLGHEQPTAGTAFPGLGKPWAFTLTPRLRPYRHVKSVEDYLRTLEALLAVPTPAAVPATPSPLALPTALDFLDSVWRNTHERQPLFAHRSHVSQARLALRCGTPDELDANLSAFAGVIERLQVPSDETKEGTLARLSRHLVGLGCRQERVEAAVATLRAIVKVRAQAQHDPASHEVMRAYGRLGVRYPPTDPGATWDGIVAQAVSAVDTLREELQEVLDSTPV